MRLAFLDCFAGISGDMFLGALLDAGLPPSVLHEATAALNLGATLEIAPVLRAGIAATKVVVSPGNAPSPPPHRSLSTIRTLIENASLAAPVKALAIHAFNLLGSAEARIHSVSIENIHFHEVGAVDSIVDIVAASAGIVHLNLDQWTCSPLNVGGGTIKCAHGLLPVPAPATADLLKGLPTYSAHIDQELVTPTGAALIRALNPTFGPQPPMQVEHIGYGAGSRDPATFPNVLRLSIGESPVKSPLSPNTETITLLETALDDASPQLLAYTAERLLTLGALDVMLTPVLMKKGRPGTLVTVLARPADTATLTTVLLRELPTLGVRTRSETRTILDRQHTTVETVYGSIRIKIASQAGEILHSTPEFEDCRAAAEAHQVPLKQVQQAALQALSAR